jgi:hypothetical protein
VGINAAWAIIDEPASQDEEVPIMILARLRDPRAKLKQLVLTGTPQGFNWYYDWCHHEGTEIIKARSYDNPHLDGQYIAEMRKRYTDEEVKAYIEGEFIRFEGAWYKTVPEIRPYRTTNLGAKIFREPHNCSDQLVIGVDTAGGLGRDRSAVALVDKRDQALCASWVDANATIDSMNSVVHELSLFYQKNHVSVMPPFIPAAGSNKPVVLVEANGIGQATYQFLVQKDPTMHIVRFLTKENTRYAGLLQCKRLVEAGKLAGPEELAEEARDLFVEDQKFRGKKDLSMAIGFCLNHIQQAPYMDRRMEIPQQTLDLMAKIPTRKKGW